MVKFIVDTKEAQKQINKLIKDLEFQTVFQEAAKIMMDEARENFDRQGALYQGGGFTRTGGAFANKGKATTRRRSWQPLALGTKKDRKRHGYSPSRPILIRDGTLKNAFKADILKNGFEVENNIDYAKYHQFGTKFMPQRMILDYSKKFDKAFIQLIINFVNKRIRENGLSN